jgi:hypothetical protein
MRNAHKILVGKPDGKKTTERPINRGEGNIKMDLKEAWLEGVNLIHLAQDRDWCWALVNTVMNLQVP